MRSEVITACTIDGAVERILEELKEDIDGTSSGRRHNVIYFDGWDGLGASAVLRDVGRRLAPAASGEKKPAPAPGLEFSRIIHIDCSKWESRRVMQRSLAEQLKLPPLVMKMFDAQDEEDDYNGVGMGSRAELPQVADAIYQHIQKQLSSRVLVIFNNGSCEEIDLESFGFPLSGYSKNKAMWTFQGAFRLYPRTKVNRALENTRATDVVFSAACNPTDSGFNWFDILHHEAAEVSWKINIGGINWAAAAADCFLYMVKLCRMGSHLIDYDLATHSCNYWKCDGIIQQLQHGSDDDRVWRSYDVLHHEMRLDLGYYQSPSFPPPVRRSPEQIPYWTSPTCGFMLIPDQYYGHIPNDMFQQYDKLRVLKLSACTFSFTSPPFLCCHNLRFLWLDHCRDEKEISSTDGVGKEEDIRECFQKLWVLDMRYSSSGFLSAKMTDFMTQLRELDVMGQDIQNMDALHGRLHNIRRFRVTKSSCTTGRIDPTSLFSGKDKMELLDLSGNSGNMQRLSVVSSCTSLETVIIDGSISLKDISLKGCAKLKNLLLSGLFPQLYSLDITGTAVKILDLRAVASPALNELFLLGCRKLYTILWPPEEKRKRYLGKLRMSTTQKETSNTFTAPATDAKGISPLQFDWYISASDEKILGSLAPVKVYFDYNYANVEISTTPSPTHQLRSDGDGEGGNKGNRMKSSSGQQGNLQRLKFNSIYADVAATFKEDTSKNQQAHEGHSDAWGNSLSFIQTRIPRPMEETLYHSSKQGSLGCYMHIEDEMMRSTLQAASHITVPGFICDGTNILHVHDGLSITSIFAAPLGSSWNKLEWCQVERCPKLECVFNDQLGEGPEGSRNHMEIFKKLKTIWASHLLNARHVLEHIGSSKGPSWHRAFADLTLLHLYCCPRMVYGVPLQQKTVSLLSLETIEIMWCGDLSVAFHLLHDETGNNVRGYTDECRWLFPNLKHIHLHELPRLRGIFSDIATGRIIAPRLETIRIRGCWSLIKLPPFIYGDSTVCDCEKEWWDRTEESIRDKMISYHCKPTHTTILVYNYKLTHPRYYKKTMLRASVLR